MGENDRQDSFQHAALIQSKYVDRLMQLPHVVGVGLGYANEGDVQTDEIAIIVMVDEKLPQAQLAPEDVIPQELEGVRVDVQNVGGGFSAFSADTSPPYPV